MTDELGDQQLARMDKALDHLMEFFDTVQILATYEDSTNGSTYSFVKGRGNAYARAESCREYIVKNDERVKIHARKEDT